MSQKRKRVVRKAMSDGGASEVVRLASAEGDPSNDGIFIHLYSPSSSSSSLTVCAPAALLVKVPYFATQLSQPWIDSPPQQGIALECTPGSSPQYYLQCLRFLTSSSPTSWPPVQASVSEVLQLLPVADHLLFQECWDTCMAVLASSPWSIDEEDAIRAAISHLNTMPSPDVRERLDTSHDGVALEGLFRKMLTSKSSEASFIAWCQACLNHPSASFAAAFHSILLKVMQPLSPAGRKASLPREWYVLAKVFLQFTDAQQLILYLVNSEELLEALSSQAQSVTCQQNDMRATLMFKQALARAKYNESTDACHIFKQMLEKVEKRVVLLTNSERARLVKWSKRGCFSPLMDDSTTLRLAETLPFGDAARMNTVVSDDQVLTRWIWHVSHRVSQMDEAGLKAVCEKFENFTWHEG